MARTDELYSKIDALLEEFADMSYEDLADVFDYYASDLRAKSNRE